MVHQNRTSIFDSYLSTVSSLHAYVCELWGLSTALISFQAAYCLLITKYLDIFLFAIIRITLYKFFVNYINRSCSRQISYTMFSFLAGHFDLLNHHIYDLSLKVNELILHQPFDVAGWCKNYLTIPTKHRKLAISVP